jgi:hypothetical protein
VEPAARPSAVSALPGHLEAFKFNASSGPSFLSHLAGAQAQLRACVPPRCSCTLAFIKAPVPEALFRKSSVLNVFHARSNASTQPIVRADAQRQAATGPHFILGLPRPAVVRRSTQTLGASNAGERSAASEPSSSWCCCGFKARPAAFSWPRVLRRSAHSVSCAAVNCHRWCGPSVLRRPAHGFSRFAVRCAWRIVCFTTRAVCQGRTGWLSCVVCSGASFNRSVPKLSGVACEARAQSRAARAAVTGLMRSEQLPLSRRWQTHGRECQSVQQVRLSQRST